MINIGIFIPFDFLPSAQFVAFPDFTYFQLLSWLKEPSQNFCLHSGVGLLFKSVFKSAKPFQHFHKYTFCSPFLCEFHLHSLNLNHSKPHLTVRIGFA